ncbi:transcriptional regulator [Intrasporangium oryzae NRRL B-24470]|uniref:Transcriptional regulator n=1 Tax=Intrasporangium oryzae NRRL B-24470 TaxID=1386089 RepID=W9G6D3_9MICO|nr:class I SAM-dependent methyltransferase [Intrasporangium oryzae]EWT01741.1 transcriptional regulator [Intrasporangium oryzae NRRL B-24470]
MDEMTRPETVALQYARTDNLQTRRTVWGPGPEGVSPADVLRTAVVSARPNRVLEIGCGTGHFARSVLDAIPQVDYLATDVSEAMVEATRALGVRAVQASAESLPFPGTSFDVVVAAWMLYHVPDLAQTLREVRRVLRPGGVLAVATNGEEHLGDLLREAGGRPLVTQFTSENAEESLGRHFGSVVRRDVETRATFPDHASAAGYLATFDTGLAAALPYFDGERTFAGHTSVLVAR